jgi:hypothetical protein
MQDKQYHLICLSCMYQLHDIAYHSDEGAVLYYYILYYIAYSHY